MEARELYEETVVPADLGFGIWADDQAIADAVEYVNRLRSSEHRTLREVVEDLEEIELCDLPVGD